MGVIAYDDADQAVYNVGPSWVNGQNGGFGWGAWVIPCSTFSGGVYDLQDSNLNGVPAIGPGINGVNNMAWYMNASSSFAAVERAFPKASVDGDFFCCEIDPSVTGEQVLRLYDGPYSTTLPTFATTVTPLPTEWEVNDATGTLNTGFAVDSGGFLLQFAFGTGLTYILTIIRYSDGQSYTTTVRTMNEQPNFFMVENTETTNPTDSLFLNTLVYADSSGGYSGCAGDPHFVGFDGVRFDFHDHGRFLLWRGAGLWVEGVFSMEDKGKDHADWKDKTFISELTVIKNGKREAFHAYDKFDPLPEDIMLAGKRGLVQDLEFVPGNLIGGRVINFPAGKLVITQFEEHGFGVRHLNASFFLSIPWVKARGIIGQTLYPTYMRKPNEQWIIKSDGPDLSLNHGRLPS